MNNQHKILRLVEQIKNHLTQNYDGAIKKLIIFGSYARGEATEDSDVDVAIIVADNINPRIIENELDELTYDILLKYNELISVIAIPEDTFKKSRYPIIVTISKEGISV